MDEGLDINFVSEDLNNILKNKGVTLEEFNAPNLEHIGDMSLERSKVLESLKNQIGENKTK